MLQKILSNPQTSAFGLGAIAMASLNLVSQYHTGGVAAISYNDVGIILAGLGHLLSQDAK